MATSSDTRTTAPGSASASRTPADVWDGLSQELAELASLARSGAPLADFYAEALRRAVAALAAEGGAVWAPQPSGRLKQLCVIAPEERPCDDEARRRHEQLLAATAAGREVKTFAPRSQLADDEATNPTANVLIVAPVLPTHSGQDESSAALVEIALRPGASPSFYRGAEEFLNAVAEVGAEFHALSDLARLRSLCDEQQWLLTLGERVHGSLQLNPTAAAIANESRTAIGCDRVSVLAPKGRGSRLLAASGVDRPNRRSQTVRGLEKLAAISRQLGDPLYLADDQEDALPQAAEALHQYADVSHARQVAVVPMRVSEPDNDQGQIVGVLVAESFAGTDAEVARDRVAEAAVVCAPALRNSLEVDAIPLFGLLQSLRGLARPSAVTKITLALAALVALAAALWLVPAELRIEARGELQPVARNNVFAPGAGIVEELSVEHGQQVAQGDLLARLRDPELDLEIKRVDGERRTTQRQLEAVRATRTSLNRRDTAPTEAYRLSAEEQQLTQRLAALEEQKQLLASQRDSLTLHSPLDGMVVTWELEESLLGRPVERGQVLMTIADSDAAWRIELQLPDDRIGYLLDAQQTGDDEPLVVEYRLGSQEEGFLRGRVTQIAQRADQPESQEAPGAMRTVAVYATPDDSIEEVARDGELRPGASVRARVLCGERSLGYVWMHDLVNAARVWWDF